MRDGGFSVTVQSFGMLVTCGGHRRLPRFPENAPDRWTAAAKLICRPPFPLPGPSMPVAGLRGLDGGRYNDLPASVSVTGHQCRLPASVDWTAAAKVICRPPFALPGPSMPVAGPRGLDGGH